MNYVFQKLTSFFKAMILSTKVDLNENGTVQVLNIISVLICAPIVTWQVGLFPEQNDFVFGSERNGSP